MKYELIWGSFTLIFGFTVLNGCTSVYEDYPKKAVQVPKDSVTVPINRAVPESLQPYYVPSVSVPKVEPPVTDTIIVPTNRGRYDK